MTTSVRRTLVHLTLLQVAGEAILLAMFWIWLGILDGKTWQLALTAVLGLAILVGFGCLQTYTFAAAAEPTAGTSLRATLRHTPRVLAVFLAFAISCWLLSLLPVASAAQTVASYVTLHLRVPIRPARTQANLAALLAIIKWAILPILMLPLCSELARGLEPRRPSHYPRVWAGYALAVTLGAYLPWRLIHWQLHANSPPVDLALFAVRFSSAYLLCCAAIVGVAAVAAAGSPAPTQASTVERR